MDANQFFAIADQYSSPPETVGQGVAARVAPSARTDFSDLFNVQMLAQVRQEFAAPVQVHVDLQLVSLGPKMNLITADVPLPDLDSLTSFARAQGLDEEAVETLFGSSTVEKEASTAIWANAAGLAHLPVQGAAQEATDTVLQLAAALGWLPQAAAVVPGTAQRPLVSVLPAAPAPIVADPLIASLISLQVSQQAPTAAHLESAPVVEIPPQTGDDPMQPALRVRFDTSNQEITRRLSLMSGDSEKASWASLSSAATSDILAHLPVQGAAQEATDTVLQLAAAPGWLPQAAAVVPGTAQRPLVSVLPAAPAPIVADPLIASLISLQVSQQAPTAAHLESAPVVEIPPQTGDDPMQPALRVRFDISNQEITRRLSLMSGNSEKASWASLSSPATSENLVHAGLGKPLEKLIIDVPAALLSGSDEGLVSSVSDSSAGVTLLNGVAGEPTKWVALDLRTGSVADPETQSALAEQRRAQYQQLADRVGQSLGERLRTQIDKGEWKLQLRLQPESLGRVDVALEMRGGALDASFASDNSMTRDLILQGAGKLRETFSQSGMAVAHVWVGGDEGRRHDGNPTAGRFFKGTSGTTRKNEVEGLPSIDSQRNISTGSDGLDVLA